ncbi:DUF378 domain-containing protein [Candidatus Peregrinibacteria bacterium]|nr:DUF378 domain-containing protein [Candidatus Peregrinibacteria bacterium]
MKKLNVLDWVALVLVIVGGLNWALVGLFYFDLVSWLFVQTLNLLIVARIVYVLVGVAALYLIYTASKMAK